MSDFGDLIREAILEHVHDSEIRAKLYEAVDDEYSQPKYDILQQSYQVKTLNCGCEVEVEVEVDTFDISIDYCETHIEKDIKLESMQNLLNAIAHEKWLQDDYARWKPENRELFKLANL